MKTPSASSFEPYLTGARSARAKSLGTLVLGATALAALPSEADAQIIVPTMSGTTSLGYQGGYLHFSATTGVFGSPSPSNFMLISQYVGYPKYATRGLIFGENNGFGQGSVSVGSGHALAKLAANTVIGPGGSLAFATDGWTKSYDSGATSGWASGTGYIGLKFSLADGIHYGWVKLQTDSSGASFQVLSMAYNSVAGASILAGETTSAVPEPATSAALLALGAAGLVAYRQRKKIQRAA